MTSATQATGQIYWTTVESPVGPLDIIGPGEGAVSALYLGRDHKHRPELDPRFVESPDALRDVTEQLAEYFAGDREVFELRLQPLAGTPFQRRVWEALREIPYGATWSYGQLAAHLGSPGASRAVGLANGRNPISIIVPCHRVVGASGKLTGYGGGVERKRWLLDHERGAIG